MAEARQVSVGFAVTQHSALFDIHPACGVKTVGCVLKSGG